MYVMYTNLVIIKEAYFYKTHRKIVTITYSILFVHQNIER